MNRPKRPSPRPVRHVATSLDLGVQPSTGRAFVGFLSKHLLAAHALLNPPLRELSLALVGDARMSALHEQFMNIAGPTDVLTFPLDFDARGRAISGEVIVCVPEARRQARIRGTGVERELLLYALHGMLHLSGYDDRTDSDYRRMHRKEDQILTSLGLGSVFSAGERRAGTDDPAGRRARPRRARRPGRSMAGRTSGGNGSLGA